MRNHFIAVVLSSITACGLLGCSARCRAAEKPEPPRLAMPADWDRIKADPAALARYRCPKPAEFALVFSFGYGQDLMPKEDARFEALVKAAKEAGFNVIHCDYSDQRLAICRKHGVKMMINFLGDAHHVYKSPEACEAVCRKVAGDPAVWGYNIWNDAIPRTAAAGRVRDIANVRTWDPTHPAYCGGYRDSGASHLSNADVLGYYDFHWRRGVGAHLGGYPMKFLGLARGFDAFYYSWLGTQSGKPGEENYRRNLWSANIGIACGLKGILWFLAPMNKDTLQWLPEKDDIARINRSIGPMATELATIGNPAAVYATPRSKDMSGAALPADQAGKPPGGFQPLAADFWIQPVRGEVIMGLFPSAAGDAIYVANQSAVAAQEVTIRFTKAVKPSKFDRGAAQYKPLEVKDNAVRFTLEPGGGELLRLHR